MELLQFPLSTLITFFFVFLFVLSLVLVLRRSSKRTRLPPGPWKLPFIGSIHHLLMAGSPLPHHALRSLSMRYGPLMHLQLGEISLMVVSSPRMAEQVMKNHDLVFAERPQLIGPRILTYNNQSIAFAPYGAYWRQMRKICTLELLTAKSVQSFASIREDEVAKLVTSIKSSSSGGGGEGVAVNVTEKLFSLFNAVTARAAFGKRCKDKDIFVKSLLEAITIAGAPHLCDMFPSLKILALVRRRWEAKAENVHKRLDMVLDKIIKEHEQNLRSGELGEEEEDLVDALLRHQKSGGLDFPMTNNNVKAVIQDIFSGGTETSSTAVGWAMSELMRKPEVMEKVQTEVREASWKEGKKTINQGDVQGLKYLKMVIKETLRLHPPLPLLLPRESRAECCIDGYNIPIKTLVVINAWAIGRDPEHWEDAESFRPERFDGTSSCGSTVDYTGTQFHYVPFGAGRRMCPGVIFAIASVEFALAQLLYHFNWQLPDGTRPDELDMTEAFGITAERKRDLYLVATPYDHDN